MGGFYDFYRELERRSNVAIRVSVQDGPVLWEDVAARDVPQEVLVERMLEAGWIRLFDPSLVERIVDR